MTMYIILAFLTFLLGKRLQFYSDNNIDMPEYYRNKKIIEVLFFVLVVWVAVYSLRGTTGTDAGGYRSTVKLIVDANLTLEDRLASRSQTLFALVEYFGAVISKGSWVFTCILYSLVTYIPVLFVIKKKSSDISYSILHYVLSMSIFFGYNAVKQACAVGITLIAYQCFLKERKYAKYIICMVIAYFFHQTALFIIPFHFLSLKKMRSGLSILAIFGFFIGVFFFGSVWSGFMDIVGLVGEEGLVNDYAILSGTGSSVLRVLVAFSPIVLGVFNINRMRMIDDEVESDLILCIFGAILSIYSLINPVFTRIAAYFDIMNITMLPVAFEACGEKRYQIRAICIFLYFIFMVSLLLHGDSHLYPYVPVWESGKF